jgi:hypothetical protein
MSDEITQETIKALMARRQFHAKRLEGNSDFKAIQALDMALSELGGRPTRLNGVGSGKLSQKSAARKAILDHGVPLSTKRLLVEIPKLGVQIGGKNPTGNLVSILSGSGEFQSVRWKDSKGWWPKDEPIPEE